AVLADAAWVEINHDAQNGNLLLTQNISKKEVESIHQYFRENNTLMEGAKTHSSPAIHIERSHYDKKINTLTAPGYRSVLWMPLVIKNVPVGALVVLKEVADGFNKEMVGIVGTFAS